MRTVQIYHADAAVITYLVLLLGGMEAYFDPKKRQAVRIDQPKKMKNSEEVKLPPYP